MVYRVCLVMLFRSTLRQSSSIWKVMSALWITVRDACDQVSQRVSSGGQVTAPAAFLTGLLLVLSKPL